MSYPKAIFYYSNRNTGKFIGYHISSFCQLSKEERDAKKYDCYTLAEVNHQRDIIRGNLETILNENTNTNILPLNNLIKSVKKEFNNLDSNSININVKLC